MHAYDILSWPTVRVLPKNGMHQQSQPSYKNIQRTLNVGAFLTHCRLPTLFQLPILAGLWWSSASRCCRYQRHCNCNGTGTDINSNLLRVMVVVDPSTGTTARSLLLCLRAKHQSAPWMASWSLVSSS